MLRQAVVLGGRAVIPVAMGLVLTSPGFAQIAEARGAGSGGTGAKQKPHAVIAAPADVSTFRAGDPVSSRAKDEPGWKHDAKAVPGRGTFRKGGHASEAAAEGEGIEATPAPSARPGVEPAAGPGADAPESAPVADSAPPAMAISAQLATRGVSAAIGQAISVGAELPVLHFDAQKPAALRSLSGWLRRAAPGMRVELALRRGAGKPGCAWWVAHRARFSAVSRASCGKPRWLRATMRRTAAGLRWKLSLGGSVPAGRHSFVVRVLDSRDRPVDIERR